MLRSGINGLRFRKPDLRQQIVAKLREAERLQGQAATMAGVCEELGCSEQTFYRVAFKVWGVEGGRGAPIQALEQETRACRGLWPE
jgi:hypothetical protein